jgi:cell division protein FtsI/penicillin-binding protein 2
LTMKNTNNDEQSRRDAPQKILSPASRCRISMDGVSEACSPERPCTQSTGWERTREQHNKRNFSKERQRRDTCFTSFISPGSFVCFKMSLFCRLLKTVILLLVHGQGEADLFGRGRGWGRPQLAIVP